MLAAKFDKSLLSAFTKFSWATVPPLMYVWEITSKLLFVDSFYDWRDLQMQQNG